MGVGGSGAGAGAGASAGGASSTSAGGASAGGTSSNGGAGATGGTGTGPIGAGGSGPAQWTCDKNLAYWGASIAFSAPTPAAFATALASLKGAHPVSLVLNLKSGVLYGALSATVPGPGGPEVFPKGEVPPLAPAVPSFLAAAVTTMDPQPTAFLHFIDLQGPVVIQVEHVQWTAEEGVDCNDMSIDVQAVVPTSQNGIVLHLATGNKTIGELVAPPPSDDGGLPPVDADVDGGPSGSLAVPLHLSFKGASMTFDFSTL